MVLQMPRTEARGYTKMLREVLSQVEWFLNIGDCRLPSCQAKKAKLHQLVLLITSSAGVKFLMNIRTAVPNKHQGADPCLTKYSAEHIYNPAG